MFAFPYDPRRRLSRPQTKETHVHVLDWSWVWMCAGPLFFFLPAQSINALNTPLVDNTIHAMSFSITNTPFLLKETGVTITTLIFWFRTKDSKTFNKFCRRPKRPKQLIHWNWIVLGSFDISRRIAIPHSTFVHTGLIKMICTRFICLLFYYFPLVPTLK